MPTPASKVEVFGALYTVNGDRSFVRSLRAGAQPTLDSSA